MKILRKYYLFLIRLFPFLIRLQLALEFIIMAAKNGWINLRKIIWWCDKVRGTMIKISSTSSANGIDPDTTSKQDAVYAAVQLCALLAGRKRWRMRRILSRSRKIWISNSADAIFATGFRSFRIQLDRARAAKNLPPFWYIAYISRSW